ncbi:MAG: tetratricopeptide repeat protein [Alphaproteobacteria bacterium]|nr:tetratricopeptide repeat protein [Alphaproteobacteria bacterium]
MTTQADGSTNNAGSPAPGTDILREAFDQLQHVEALRMSPGKSAEARTAGEQLVEKHPEYFGALYTLGLIYIDTRQFPQALGCLVRAAMLDPQSWRAMTALSAVYLQLGAPEMAAHTLEQALLINPEDAGILATLGEIYRDEREYELARDAYMRSRALDPGLDAAAAGLGSCHAHLGEHANAAKQLQGLFDRGTRTVGLMFEINNLPPSVVGIDVIAETQRLEKPPETTLADFETSKAFILAAALDRAGRHDEAWSALVPANQTLYQTHRRDAHALAAIQNANLAQLSPKNLEVKGDGATQPVSLFILGPSRSGKTTLETLAGSLAHVKKGYENPSVENAVRRTFQSAGLLTSGMFEMLPPALDEQCRQAYEKELARRAASAKVFTNTHPGRIHDVGRVAGAFENVRFVFVKRDIEDNLLRIFMRKYLSKNTYGYDLGTIREHIIWYHQMIDMFAEKLPDIVRVVHYEQMVSDPGAVRSTLADLCALAPPSGPLPEIGDDRGCAKPYAARLR